MSTISRTMLSFVEGRQRFNYRVAGIAVREGHVLVCREDDDDYVLLPGGRVEFGEASDMALHREISEELKCVGRVGAHLFTVENFFARNGEDFHEIGTYYGIELPAEFPFVRGEPCLVTRDEGHDLYFEWIETAPSALEKINLLPRWLYPHLGELPERHRHLVVDER